MFDGKPYKPRERAQARALRTQGWSYHRIARELGISPSSALKWTRDIELTPEQIAMNLGKGTPAARDLVMRRAAAWSAACRRRRESHQQAGRVKAREGDPLHCAGCMLYWAEGAKNKNSVLFANSDLGMVRFFAGFARAFFEVPDDHFTVRLNVYLGNGLALEEIESHWLGALDLPRECLRKHSVDHFPTSSSGSRVNKLPYGVCTLRILKSTHIVQHIYGAIQEYAGFDEPRWLG
jgi:transposase-like protein